MHTICMAAERTDVRLSATTLTTSAPYRYAGGLR